MLTYTRDHIQMLLDQPRGMGMVVSCYANTSVVEGFESHWLQPLKAEASKIRQHLAEDPRALEEFERDLVAIRNALGSQAARQARGMAVFSAAARGFFLAVPSDSPFEDRLVVDEEPYVVPLLEAYIRERGYLVVVADTHRARVYASDAGGSRLIDELEEAVPSKTRAAGERWGKQQATIDRHRKDHILHFHKELAQRLDQAWDEAAYQGIVLLGEREVLEHFRGLLVDRLSRRVVHEAPFAWTEAQAEIDATVRGVIETARASGDKRVLDELSRRLHEACAVAAGPQEVIEALRNGQVSELILGPDPGAIASRCTNCDSLFAFERDTCPFCSAPCRRGNLWQQILDLALGHGVWVNLVRGSPELERHSGVAALLARNEAQWA